MTEPQQLVSDYQRNVTAGISDSVPSLASLSNGQLAVVWGRNGREILGKLYVCSRDCILTPWSDYTNCSAECGGGVMRR